MDREEQQDEDKFTLSSNGLLEFKSSPDYESPASSNSEDGNIYVAQVIADVSYIVVRGLITVTVTDVDEEGTVTLSTTAPVVGHPLGSALDEPDGGVRDLQWQWQRRLSGTTNRWEDVSSSGARSEEFHQGEGYTPKPGDVGYELRATVGYTDVHDEGKSAQSAATAPVVDVPSAPRNLEAAAGNGRVDLRWDPPLTDNGSALTGYGYRYGSGGSWTPGTLGLTPSHTIDQLTNGTAYTFELWAVNGAGNSDATSVTSTPLGAPDPPVLSVEEGDGRVRLRFVLGSDNGSGITRRDTRVYRLVDGARLWPFGELWFDTAVDPSSSDYPRRFTSGYSEGWQGLTNGLEYTFEVRTVNGVGTSAIARVTATPRGSPPPRPVRVTYGASSYSAQEGGEAATVTVRLSPSASEALSIPITVNPPSGDFAVAGLTDGGLSFAPEADEATFTITAGQDADTVDEEVTLGFRDLPSGVVAGTPSSATVRLVDDDPDEDDPDDDSDDPVGTPGEVRLSTASPQVGRELTATLVDVDGGLEAVAWQWQRRADASSGWVPIERSARIPIAATSRYTPVTADRGQQLRATVSYTDAHGPDSAQSEETEPVTWPSLTVFFSSSTYQATEGGEAATVTVRLSPPAFQALRIPIAVNPPSGDFAVAGLTDGGLSFAPEADEATFTVTASEDADTVDETVTLGFGTPLPEGVSAGDPGSATVTLVDDDPDEDDPDDDSDDPVGTPGEVRLSTASPQVGRELTATLVDVDGGLDAVAWQWQRRADASSGWVPIERSARTPIAATSHYTPVTADRGQQLRATVSYTDAHGPDSAQSEETEPVTWPSLTVFFSSSTYQATEGGEAASVTVRLSPSASEALSIPIAVNPPSGDFAVAGLTDGGLSFAPEADEATFTVTASEDADTADEEVTLGFGRPLPEGVSAGDPGSATVTLVDDDPDEDDPDDDSDDPVGTPGEVRLSTASPQVGRELTATLVDVDGGLDAVAWQWQRRADASSGWVPIERSARTPIAATSRYTPVTADRGQQLRATVSYTDAHGPDSAQSEETEPVTWPSLTVFFSSSTYQATEGGEAASVTVRLSPSASEALSIPIAVNPPSGDFAVAGLTDGGLSFAPEADEATFTVTASEDADTADEEVTLGFGRPLPEGVSAGDPGSATVTLVDDDPDEDDPDDDSDDPVGTPGEVRLSTASPQVGRELTATLVDVDGGLDAVAWQWQRRADASSGWVPVERSARTPIAATSHYTPVTADVGQQLRATVGYTDAHGPGKSAQSEETDPVTKPDTPGEVRLSTASPEVDQRVTATLTDFDGGLEAVAWQWQQRADAGSAWVPIERSPRYPIADLSRYTPVTADRGKQLRATVGYTDAHGPGKSAQSAATSSVRPADTPGTVRLSTASPEVGQRVTATLTDFDGALEAVAWQWQRQTAGSSTWETLEQTERNPDLIADLSHYTPVAADRGKQLRATVGYTDAHGPNKSAQSAATSSVRPADTPGTVRLSTSSPEVGQRVTATLTDFDGGLEAVAWQWQQRADAGSAWVPIERSPRYPIVDQSHYTPVAADRGKQLRATVGYTDAHGPDKSAQSDATAAVKAPNRPPVIDDTGTQSVPENTRSVATFTATDPEGQAITWSVIGNVFQISSSGEVSFQNAPSYESGTTSYSLTVRATDPKGASDTETVTVNVTDVDEPPGPPSNVRVSAAGRTSVEVEWDAPNTSGRPPVTDYDVQYRASGNWRTHSFSGTGTSTTISSLTPNTAYEVQVNAANDEGTSGWAAGSGRTDCGAPTISGPTSQSIPENTTAVASYSLSDPDGGGGRWLPLGGADASAFNFSGGTLSFRSAPDYETDSRQYQVTIRARGGCSSSSSASLAVTVSVRNVGPPGKPTVTVTVPATNGHEELDVGWSTSASDAPVTGWKLQYCQTNACSSTTTLPFEAGTTSTTLENLRSGTRYSVRVKATSDEGDSPWSAIRRTYTRANTAPVISGTARQNVNENTTAVGTYTATDAEGDGITWDIYSTDSDEFSFTSSGSSLTLRFESAPDYENPTDANTNNIYVVRIRATDDGNPSANSNKLINAIVQDIGPPSKMTVPTVRVPSSGTGKLDISWSHPTSGAPVTGYTMQYCYPAFRSEEDAPEEEKDDSDAPRQAVCSETTLGRVTSKTLTGLPAYTLYTVRLKATSREGTGPWSNSGSAITRSAAAKALAEQLALTGLEGLAALAAPNPFNPSTTIYFQVPEAGEVSLVIYSLAGQVVRKLIPGRTLKAGIYDVFWEGRDEQGRPVAAGVYFYRLRAGDRALVRKMTLLR